MEYLVLLAGFILGLTIIGIVETIERGRRYDAR